MVSTRRANVGIVWVSTPGDYATFNSNHTPDGTHRTLPDRLVKELRLAGARTLAEGNTLLPAFIADYNPSFAKPSANKKDLHLPLRASDDLEDPFAWKKEGTLSQALRLQYDKVIFILEPSELAKAAMYSR